MAPSERVIEYRPQRGQLNADTLAWMGHWAREASRSESLRRLCERRIRDAGVPARDDYGELVTICDLVHEEIPYRRDPVYRERVKRAAVAFGLDGHEPGLGEDCETMALCVVGAAGAMGHQPGRFVTGLGRCPHELHGERCPHPIEERRQLYGDAPCCPDSEAHVYGEVWVGRPSNRRGWMALDPVAYPNRPGFRPELFFLRYHHAIGDERRGLGELVTKESRMSQRYQDANSNPVTDPLLRFVLGRKPLEDLGELGAELEQASRYGMHEYPVGAVMLGRYAGAPGAGLVFLGAGPLGGVYADAAGGVWNEVPMAFGGIWSSIKKAASSVKSAVGTGAAYFHKYAQPAALITAAVPGVGPMVSAAIATIDKGTQIALTAAHKADEIEKQAASAIGQAKQLLQNQAKGYEAQAKQILAQAAQTKAALKLPPGIATQIAKILPTTALVDQVKAIASSSSTTRGEDVAKVFAVQRQGLRELLRAAYGFGACSGGCQLERVA